MTTTTFGVRWKKTKEIYEATVKQKKPAEKILKVFRKSTEIESGLKAFDAAADLVGMRGTDRKAAAKAVVVLAKAETAAATSIKSYLVLLQKTITDDKQADPAYTLGLKLLKADLKAITDGMAVTLDNLKSNIENWDIDTPEQAAAVMAKQDQKLIRDFAYGIKLVYSAVLKAKAQPDIDFYNETVPQSIREGLIQMQPGNLTPDRVKAMQAKRPYPKREIDHVFDYSLTGKVRAAAPNDIPQHCDAITRDLAVITAWVKSIPGAPS